MAATSTRNLNKHQDRFAHNPESNHTKFKEGRTRVLASEEVNASGNRLSPPQTSNQTIKQRLIAIWLIIVNFFCCRRGAENQRNTENRDTSRNNDVPPMTTDSLRDGQSDNYSLEDSSSFSPPYDCFDAHDPENTFPKERFTSTLSRQPFTNKSPLAGRQELSPLSIDTSTPELDTHLWSVEPQLTLAVNLDHDSLSGEQMDTAMSASDVKSMLYSVPAAPTVSEKFQGNPLDLVKPPLLTFRKEDSTIKEDAIEQDQEDTQSLSSVSTGSTGFTVKESSYFKKTSSQDLTDEEHELGIDDEDRVSLDEAVSEKKPKLSFSELDSDEKVASPDTLAPHLATITTGDSTEELEDTKKHHSGTCSLDDESLPEYSDPLLSTLKIRGNTNSNATETHSPEELLPRIYISQYASKMAYLDSVVLVGQELKILLNSSDTNYHLLNTKARASLLASLEILTEKNPENMTSEEHFIFYQNCLIALFKDESNESQAEEVITTYSDALLKLSKIVVALPKEVNNDTHPISKKLKQLKDEVDLLLEDSSHLDDSKSVDSSVGKMQSKSSVDADSDAPIRKSTLYRTLEANHDTDVTEDTPLLKTRLSRTPLPIKLSPRQQLDTLETDNDSDGEEDIYVAQTFKEDLSLSDPQQASMCPPEEPQLPFMHADKGGYLSITLEEDKVPTDSMTLEQEKEIEDKHFQEAINAKARERREKQKHNQRGSKIPISRRSHSTFNPKSKKPDLSMTEWEKEMNSYKGFTSLTRRKSEGDISLSASSGKSTSKAKSCAGYTPRTQDENEWTNPHKKRKKENHEFRKRKSTEFLKMGFGSKEESKIKRDPNTFR